MLSSTSGKLKSETEKIKNLAADIKKWHKEVTTSSNTAANDIYNKMSIVKEIQKYTQNAATRVQEVGTVSGNLTLMLLVTNLANTKWYRYLENDWNPGT